MSKLYITFKTFALKQIKTEPIDSENPSYPLSMLRSVLLLKGISQLMPSSIGFREFCRQALEGRKVAAPGPFTILINQILEFYSFDHDILRLSPGFTRIGDHEYWFDTVKDPSTHQTVIFLKTSNLASFPEVLQLARLEAMPGSIYPIYHLLQKLRLPEINLQEIVDGISSDRDMVASLTAFIQKILFDPKEEMGVLEVFLLLGQEKFKEWVLSEIVLHSKDLVPPQAERFQYPSFNLSFLPGSKSLNAPGLIEAIYILGFLGLADEIHREGERIQSQSAGAGI